MIDTDATGDFKADVQHRLLLTRRAVSVRERAEDPRRPDLSQKDFAARAGLTQPHYNQVETGVRLIGVRAAIKLCDAHGLTLDWIYRGDPSGLPVRLADAIRILRQPSEHRR
jgi:transcriptional regulator with XRE-family HTH domain